MISCLIFVVAALIEFAVVVLISRSTKSMNRKSGGSLSAHKPSHENEHMATGIPHPCWTGVENKEDVTENEGVEGSFPKSLRRCLVYISPYIIEIDLAAFCIYLFMFVLFNCIYWPACLKRENVYN